MDYRTISTTADLDAVAHLAFEVFYEEMGLGGPLIDAEAQRLEDSFEAEVRYEGAFDGDELVGCVAFLKPRDGSFGAGFDTSFSVDAFAAAVDRSRMRIAVRFMVRESHRNTSVPLRLVSRISEVGASEDAALIFADCQPHLIDLYEALGFDRVGPAFDQPGFGMMVPLVLVASGPYLAAKRSMLKRYVGPLEQETQVVQIITDLAATDPLDAAAVWTDAWATRQVAAPASLLEDLTPQQIETLCSRAKVIDAPAGSAIVTEGQGARTAYVILNGTVSVRSAGRELASLSAGRVVGELAMLLGKQRTADVVAVTDVRVVALNDKVLTQMVERDPQLAARLYRNLSRDLAVKLARRR